MSDDLPAGRRIPGDVLLIVVDKRVDISLNGGEARDVELVLYSGKVLKANLLLAMAQCLRFRRARSVSQIRNWRNDGSLNSVRTTQYCFTISYTVLPQTARLRHVVNGDSSMISDLANMG